MTISSRLHTSRPDLELLAPAGTVEVFEAAIENGADAVYVGAPFLNARALAKPFTMAEIAAMTDFAHDKGVRLYIAMNSLLKDVEVRDLVKMLLVFEDIGVDALIIQDLGVYSLVKRYFPKFRIHASTLCTAHNSISVQQLESMGFDRVVLAREMTLAEIQKIKSRTAVELEAFVHGAMCFSYSGLCLFSSFLGGKSGLRGRCVQPCRRCYTWQGKGKTGKAGYLFSMNDLDGLDLIDDLRKAGVTSLKLEGRMRSSGYVGTVVKAYRMVLDAYPNGNRAIMAEARDLLSTAMGRKSSSGYFLSSVNPDLIAHQHSGNIGLFMGLLEKGGTNKGILRLQHDLQVGDRLRLHLEQSGERKAFTLKKIMRAGKGVNRAASGEIVELEIPSVVSKKDSLYKVDTKESRSAAHNKTKLNPDRYRQKVQGPKHKNLISKICFSLDETLKGGQREGVKKKRTRFPPRETATGRRGGAGSIMPLPWWLKVDNINALKKIGGPSPDKVMLALGKEVIIQTSQISALRRNFKGVVLALPTIIEEADVDLFQKEINKLVKNGINDWQIGHLGQLRFFAGHLAKKVRLYGDFSLNVVNALTASQLKAFGLSGTQLSIEADRESLTEICRKFRGMDLGMTVYGLPPLFTSRAAPEFFRYDTNFVSPKNEVFFMRKNFGQTIALPSHPFSLLPWLAELEAMGLNYVVVDLTNMPLSRGILPAIIKEVAGKKKGRPAGSINYLGRLF